MILSDDGIKSMGFIEQLPPFEIKCKYYCIKIYTIQGVHFDSSEDVYVDQLNDYCRFGIGNNINEICLKLAKDTYVKDLEKWEKDKKVKEPYLMTLTTNNKEYVSLCDWKQVIEEIITTYNFFRAAKQELDDFMDEWEIPYIPLITAELSSSGRLVKVTHIDTYRYGIMPDGKCFLDITISSYSEASISVMVSLSEHFSLIIDAIPKYETPGERVSRLMYNAMQESDKTKSFLFSWTSLEVLLKQKFKKLSVSEFPKVGIPIEYEARISNLFSDPNRDRRITTITQKYAYLSIYIWKFLDISDYDKFKAVKEIRDDFAHGKKLDPLTLAQPTKEIMILLNKIIINTVD